MNAYKTTRTVRFPAGAVLALDEWQANARRHALYEMEPGVYTAKESLEFKAGETIGLMTPPAKGDSGLEPVEQNTYDDDKLAENPGAAPAQSELKKDSAVRTQESEAKPAKAGKK
jgi:hypothetical protein